MKRRSSGDTVRKVPDRGTVVSSCAETILHTFRDREDKCEEVSRIFGTTKSDILDSSKNRATL